MNSSISSLDRLSGWDRALEDFASGQLTIQPAWGRSDCLLTVSSAIQMITGIDPLEQFRGRYKTEAGAARKMRQNGCANVKDVFETYLSLEPVNRLSARRGDVGVILINGEFTAGFICGYGFAVKQPHGLVFFPVTEIEQAFKVGA